MGILGTIVRSLVMYVLHIGHYFRLGGNITAKLVSDDGPRYVLQSSQELAKELLRSPSITAGCARISSTSPS